MDARREPTDAGHEISDLVTGFGRGGRAAVDRLFPILYKELKGIARRQRRSERPGHTLNTTALVHEAYVKLLGLGASARRAAPISSPSQRRRCVESWWTTPLRQRRRNVGGNVSACYWMTRCCLRSSPWSS